MRIKGNGGYYNRGMVSKVVRKRYWFLFDDHQKVVVRKLRHWRNIKRKRSAFSRIIYRKAFLSSMY